MNTQYCIEVTCRRSEVPTFARLGFQTMVSAEPANASAVATMTHSGVDDGIVSSVVDLRLQGKRFSARIVEIGKYSAQEVK